MKRHDVVEGSFGNGVPYLRLGAGPPLIAVRLVTSEHTNPTGFERRMVLSGLSPFAEQFTVYVASGPPGLPPGATMSDIAQYYAEAIQHDVGEPVFLHGVSTGGSIALQLAMDHPHLVRRMVLAGAACRFSHYGRSVNAEMARLIAEGDYRRATSVAMAAMVPTVWRYPARALGWAYGVPTAPRDPSDALVVAAAEDTFDAEPGLGRVTAPTLVIGGGADSIYSTEIIRRTAEGIPRGSLVLFPGKSHSYVIGSKAAIHVALGFLLADRSADASRFVSMGEAAA